MLYEVITITCRSDQNELMGLRHRELAIEGVQFHPESIMTVITSYSIHYTKLYEFLLDKSEGLMAHKRIIMTSQDIDLAVQRIALQILEKNHGCDQMAIVGIHTCGVFVAKRIHQFVCEQCNNDLAFGSLDINLYRDDWSLMSQNPIVKTTDISVITSYSIHYTKLYDEVCIWYALSAALTQQVPGKNSVVK